jgi:hypothetical protein
MNIKTEAGCKIVKKLFEKHLPYFGVNLLPIADHSGRTV